MEDRLSKLLKMSKINERVRFIGKDISLSSINRLPQPRKTFKGIDELAIDIRDKGLLHPIVVAQFSEEAAQRYIDVINKLWGTSYFLKDLISVKVRGKDFFYVLLAGERRYLASSKNPKKNIRTSMCIDIVPTQALFIQMSENTHLPVPVYEEAVAYAQLYELLKIVHPNFTKKEFAARVGRGPETISNALRFSNLPDNVRESVEDGTIPYGIAIELARLQEDGMDDEELLSWVVRAVVNNFTTKTFRSRVSTHLHEKKIGQRSLIEIFEEGQKNESSGIKRIVSEHEVRRLWANIHYFKRVLSLFKRGLLGTDDSPYSEKSARALLLTEIEVLDELLGTEGFLSPRSVKRSKRTITKVRRAIAKRGATPPS